MLLCAGDSENKDFELLRPADGAKVGDRVVLEGSEGLFGSNLEPILNPKQKYLEQILANCSTNEQG